LGRSGGIVFFVLSVVTDNQSLATVLKNGTRLLIVYAFHYHEKGLSPGNSSTPCRPSTWLRLKHVGLTNSMAMCRAARFCVVSAFHVVCPDQTTGPGLVVASNTS